MMSCGAQRDSTSMTSPGAHMRSLCLPAPALSMHGTPPHKRLRSKVLGPFVLLTGTGQ